MKNFKCFVFVLSQVCSAPPIKIQSGVLRTSCVDCLDRTNVLQFFAGLNVFEQQLLALGILSGENCSIDLKSNLAKLLSGLYDRSGDELSHQYAGSAAHKK